MTTEQPDRLPTRPLRRWLLAWRICTGDPPETIAKGFDLCPRIVAELLGPRPPLMLMADEALVISAKLRLEPSELWVCVRRAGHKSDSVEVDDGVAAVVAMLPT